MPEPTMPAIGGSRTLAQAEAIAERLAAGQPLAADKPPAPAPAASRRRPPAAPKED